MPMPLASYRPPLPKTVTWQLHISPGGKPAPPRGISNPTIPGSYHVTSPHGVKASKGEKSARRWDGISQRDYPVALLGSPLRPDRRRHWPASAAWGSHEESKIWGSGQGCLNAAFLPLHFRHFPLVIRLGFGPVAPDREIGRQSSANLGRWMGAKSLPGRMFFPVRGFFVISVRVRG